MSEERMDLREFSRHYVMSFGRNTEDQNAGSLMRIADALEGLLKHFVEQSPEGRANRAEHEAREREFLLRYEKAKSVEDFLKTQHPAVRSLSRRSMANAFVCVCGVDADSGNPEMWSRVIAEAKSTMRNWGNAKVENLRTWVSANWPDWSPAILPGREAP